MKLLHLRMTHNARSVRAAAGHSFRSLLFPPTYPCMRRNERCSGYSIQVERSTDADAVACNSTSSARRPGVDSDYTHTVDDQLVEVSMIYGPSLPTSRVGPDASIGSEQRLGQGRPSDILRVEHSRLHIIPGSLPSGTTKLEIRFATHKRRHHSLGPFSRSRPNISHPQRRKKSDLCVGASQFCRFR
uniref:Uncharacterized protein n=1 Tax=Mycena chlorophos TaxID=658473 RepID=A0ABQ0L9V4_MYCCL|nr:predicted protein [Mycena chlorophos]